jgi:putative hydrolase of HD superfamily
VRCTAFALAVALASTLPSPASAARERVEVRGRDGRVRLQKQMRFLRRMERLKTVPRVNLIADGSRRENPAEHSWQMAMMALVLAEHAPAGVRLEKALTMAILHDVIEIHANDTYAYDKEANLSKDARETRAARRLFSLLPRDQGHRLAALWREFEAGTTTEAKFVRAMDRLQPVVLHRLTGGKAWKEHGVSKRQVMDRVREVQGNVPALWSTLTSMLARARRDGQLQ